MGTTSHKVNSTEHVHQRLGNVQLLTQPSKTNPHETVTIMKKIIPVQHDKEFQIWQSSLNRVKNTETLDVIFFPQHYHFEGAGMCGSTGVITLMFPDYFFVLQSQIRNREKHDQPFLETEIWYLLYNMIRAAKQYQKLNEKVGDIRPANIVINQNGQIKVISVHTCPGQLTNYEKAFESRQQNVYLSPEECRQQYIKIGQYPAGSASKTQSEIFSIGVTLLESIILKDCTILYSKMPYQFNTQPFERYKMDLRNTFYSEHLKHLVLRMLDMNPQNRPKASQIYQTLQPFENNILDLQQFRFPNQQIHMSQNQHQFIQPYSIHPSINVQQPLSPKFIQPQNINSLIQQRSLSPQYKTVHQQFNQQITKSVVPLQSYQQRTYQ